MKEKTLLNKTETAIALGVCTRTIDNLVNRGQIPSVQIGTRRLFDIDDVLAAIKAGGASPVK